MMPSGADGQMQMQQIQQVQQQQQPTFTFATTENNANALQTITNLENTVENQAIASGSNTPSQDGGDEEPLYVNAKQYDRIMKRRQARAKLENEGRIPKNRMVKVKLNSYYCNLLKVLTKNSL